MTTGKHRKKEENERNGLNTLLSVLKYPKCKTEYHLKVLCDITSKILDYTNFKFLGKWMETSTLIQKRTISSRGTISF